MSIEPADDASTRVAIIGMGGRFPGARDVDEFWRNLCAGVESITRFTDDELAAAGVSADELSDPSYVKAGAVLDGIELFDADFFGMTPREAQLVDPQQRLFLETAWTAMESAGLDPSTYDGSVGVFAGSALSTYLLHNLGPSAEVRQTASPIQVVLGNDKDSMSTRTAYAFDLRGPSYSIQSYCSTSLVAVAAACTSLVGGECDVALAGGAAISVPHRIGYRYQEGGIASPDGRCRAFDADAKGAPLGNGVGVVVLKRLDDALADGDHISAVIRGWAVNNDGSLKVGYTAPGVRGQAGVITEALANADVDPVTVDYIEAHGTGTALGDAAEFAALTGAFASVTDHGRCALGSVKTNVGHLDRAAGVTGLIKTALALEHRTLPPTLHFRRANPQIDLDRSPFRVVTELTSWAANGRPRRAGVSAFGIGGTNAHIVLEEAPERVAVAAPSGRPHLLVLSARTAAAADARVRDLADHLDEHPDADLADVAHTLRVGRREFEHRRALVVNGSGDAQAVLRDPTSARLLRGGDPRPGRPVGLIFSGVGEQYPGVAASLYRSEPVFREVLDECCELLEPLLGRDLRELLVSDGSTERPDGGMDLRALLGRGGPAGGEDRPEAALLASTAVAQPAMFVVEYALARLLDSWGVRPDAMAGYSLGEYVAATLAGVLSWPDALRLVAYRARLIDGLPAGAMVGVPLSEEELAPLLGPDLDIAAVNAPRLCVVAGPVEAVARLEARLADRDVAFRRLQTTHAFHSRALTAVADALTDWIQENVALSAPRQRYLSTLTGTWIRNEEATDPGYWARHMCAPVRFADVAAELLADPDRVLVEVGPGQSLGAFVRQHPGCAPERMGLVVPTLPGAHELRDAAGAVHGAVARLWLAGVSLDWVAYSGPGRRRVPLPTYPFQRERYWIDAPRSGAPVALAAPPAPPAEPGKRPLAQWFAAPRWDSVDAPADANPVGPFLLFADTAPLGNALGDRLAGRGPCVVVRPGGRFEELVDGTFVLRPDETDDYTRLVEILAARGQLPRTVAHLWTVTGPDADPTAAETVRRQRRLGFDSLSRLAPTLAAHAEHEVSIVVVTDHLHDLDGSEELAPGKAGVLAACLVIPQEYPTLSCRSVDLAGSFADGPGLLDGIERELSAPGNGEVVALRAGVRHVRTYGPAPDAAAPLALREGGVYLLTGGLGGVGLTLADHLARTIGRPRLVLTGRRGLPPRETWPLLVETEPDSATTRRVRRVLALEELGAEVLVLAADAADPDAMGRAVEEVIDRFGVVHGVIHGAGVTAPEEFQPLEALTAASVDRHFTAKVDSLLALDRALAGQHLDFCVLQSSMSAVLGGIGFAAYAAANSVLDAFAGFRARTGARWVSVDWDTWQSTSGPVARTGVGASMTRFSMTTEEGLAAFGRALATPAHQLAVSTGDLDARLRQWVAGRGVDPDACPRATADLFPRPDLAELYVRPRTGHERRLAAMWQETLGLERVGLNDNFFDLGGTSLMGLQLLRRVSQEYGRSLPAVALFEAPTVAALTRFLNADDTDDTGDGTLAELERRRDATRQAVGAGDIAIIGMAGRFPGARDVEEFWRNLREGVESISFFTEEELIAAGVPAEQVRQENYVKARPVLDGADRFDAGFFGYSPREAELTDPQHRVFLECAWHALEHAGYAPRSYPGQVGVFAGTNISTYLRALYEAGALDDQVSDYQAVIGNDKDALTTTVSYKLDLTGPSLAVQTFCSTSLVAVHLAVQSLRGGECDMALAGGVSIRVPDRIGHLYTEGGMESPDGHVRTFDVGSRGSMFGDGAGVVVLKRLADALADGDHVTAVIKGSAVNNDGSLKVGFTAPSVTGQTEVVRQALRDAGVAPETISYVEAHGTGTPLGDPIEVASLTRAFGDAPARGSCAIGSVKTNVGHLDRAAGVSGLVKAALALENREIPPTLHFTRPNPEIDFAGSPFHVNDRLRSWVPAPGTPRRAGINSLGMGGTNVHVVLEEAPARPPAPPGRAEQLLLLSARTEAALDEATGNLARHLRDHTGADLPDVAYTLQVGRETFAHRRAVRCRSIDEGVAALEGDAPERVLAGREELTGRPVGLTFGGDGARCAEVAGSLYRSEPSFRAVIDEGCAALEPSLGGDLRELLSGGGADAPVPAVLARASAFLVEYALARLLESWGVRPDGMAGDGVGEHVAAALAGVLPWLDALRLVVHRAQLVDGADSQDPDRVAESLTGWVRENVVLSAPRVRYLSTLTGTWIRDEEATDPGYWARHRCAPVGFADVAAELLADPDRVLVEVGPGQSLGASVVSALPGVHEVADAATVLHAAVARLWLAGVSLDWVAYSGPGRRRVPLPTYPFQRERYWVDATRTPRQRGQAHLLPDLDGDPRRTLDALPRLGLDSWLWVPAWRQSVPPASGTVPAEGPWLVLADTAGVADDLLRRFAEAGIPAVPVWAGDAYGRSADGGYVIRPGDRDDTGRLLDAVRAEVGEPRYVAHLWSLDDAPLRDAAAAREHATDRGYLSLLWLCQALGTASAAAPCDVVVASAGAYDVTGLDEVSPNSATVAGPCRVIPLEHTRIRCRQVDVLAPTSVAGAAALAGRLLGEFAGGDAGSAVAWRGNRRWVQVFEPLPRPPVDPAGLRTGGVYLVTGGLGGVGLAVAEGLARAASARLVLVSRSPLPSREDWPALADDPRTPRDLLRRVEAVQSLEALGAEVLVCAADVCDPAAMRGVVRTALDRFGGIDGVIHAAGVPGMGLVQFRTPDNATAAMDPKVTGTAVLLDSLADLSLDFVALFSSITSVTGGGPGQVDYCAANAYLDAVAHSSRDRGMRVVSIDWGEWQWNAWSAGLSGYNPETRRFFEDNRKRFGIAPEEGWQAFLAALASQQPQVVVSTQDFRVLAAISDQFTVDTVLGLGREARGRHARPDLGTSFVAPATDVQRSIAALWCEALGLTEVGIHDNFFELGGNSLLGVDLVARICRELHVPTLAPHVLYLAPSVSALADAVAGGSETEWVDDRRERGERRRQHLGRRRTA